MSDRTLNILGLNKNTYFSALSGFLEEGRQRRAERSSSKIKRNLWYCREFERIFMSSEPVCMKVKQSAATEQKTTN